MSYLRQINWNEPSVKWKTQRFTRLCLCALSSGDFTDRLLCIKKRGEIIFTFSPNLDIVCYPKKSALSDSCTSCCGSTTTRLRLCSLTFGIIVFHLPRSARLDLVCRCENSLCLRDPITSRTMWLEQHVKSFRGSNKESDFIFIAEHNDSGKLIVLSGRNHCARSKSSIRGWVITFQWKWGFKLNNVSEQLPLCLILFGASDSGTC